MRKTKEDALKTRSKIIRAALEVFLMKGYSASTLENIAKEAEVTRGAIYWHFKNKSEILDFLVHKEHSRFEAEVIKISDLDLPPMHKIKRIVNINMEALYENTDFRNFIALTWFNVEMVQYQTLLKGKREVTGLFNNKIFELLSEAIATGEVKAEVDAKMATLHITSLINGIYRGYFLLPEDYKDIGTANKLISNYLETLTNNNG